VVTEAADAGSGTDTVESSIGFTLGANLENLTLTGNANINGTGNADNNVLTGNAGNNVLSGGAGNDRLDGGLGNDNMVGGIGNDTYVVDATGDVVTEALNQGTDTVQSSINLTLGANVENLTLTGAANINGTGNTLNNVLTGNDGNNVLNGGAGADTMSGSLGNDTYVVDNAGDTTLEAADEGIDLVESSINFTLGANVENLTLTGAALNGTGNADNNVLTGNAGNNVLSGGLGNDRLDGGVGNDTMIGGGGDDTYVVNSTLDVVTEAAAQGTDTVESSIAFSLAAAALANVENLTLTGNAAINGTGNALDNVLIGNDGNNVLNGGAGADTMSGGLGNDTYVVDSAGDTTLEAADEGADLVESSISLTLGANLENLTLTGNANINGTGNAAANILIGNNNVNVLNGGEGNDTLDGGEGPDTLIGGLGDDTYIIDSFLDTVTEAAGEGTDTVQSSSLSYTLAANVENLTLLDGGMTGTGNALANLVLGNAANNIIDGGAGNDTLTGGDGGDMFVFSSALDAVTNVDTITDFSAAADSFRLSESVFSAIDDGGPLAASEFHVGAAATDADQRIVYDQTTGALFYDADGSGAGAAVRFANVAAGTELTNNHFFVA
jgi:Ca2+-binding RTX toxin-like protein